MSGADVLALEASDGGASAALWRGSRAQTGAVPAPARPAATLLPLADGLLRAADCALADLRGVGVAVGPGSYAGVRAAVATARALAWAAGLPLVAVGSLEALAVAGAAGAAGGGEAAAEVSGGCRRVAAALDARRQRVYGAVYEVVGGVAQAMRGPGLWTRSEWVTEVAEAAAGAACVVAGPGWTAAEAAVLDAALARSGGAAVRPEAVPPAAWGVAWVARQRLADGLADDPMGVVPLYLTEPDIGPVPGGAAGTHHAAPHAGA